MENHKKWMRKAIDMAKEGMSSKGGGPFGAVIVKNGSLVAAAHNRVSATQDCTQHAELYTIQLACEVLGTKNLSDCILYTSCEPCMMCLGASYWAGFKKIFYGVSADKAKEYGFIYSDMFYNSNSGKRHKEFKLQQLLEEEALSVFKTYKEKQDVK
ncbi:MAG: nucleoside deaminase [Leeuwenhoekiella sp.]